MIPIGTLPRQVLTYFVLFASFFIVAPQNVTVDDAVLTGAVVPQYLPSASKWNIGNNCSVCFVKPDPSLAYNGTWHDTTFGPLGGVSEAIEFTFTGSALYIFFILANTVPNAATLTDVSFNLDGATVGTFEHSPSTSTDYQYNVPVYVNESLPVGEHSMIIEPVNSGNLVLMLFDYLIYTAGTEDTTTSSSVSPPLHSSMSPSSLTSPSTLPVTQDKPTSSAVLIGGAVGAVGALVVVVGCIFCYKRCKRRRSSQFSSVGEGAVLASPTPFLGVAATVVTSTSKSLHQMGPSVSGHRGAAIASQTPLRSSDLPEYVADLPSAPILHSNPREEVELLRNKILYLHNLKARNRPQLI